MRAWWREAAAERDGPKPSSGRSRHISTEHGSDAQRAGLWGTARPSGVPRGGADGIRERHAPASRVEAGRSLEWLTEPGVEGFVASPVNHRLRMQLAVADQPSVNYGTTWWRREGSKP